MWVVRNYEKYLNMIGPHVGEKLNKISNNDLYEVATGTADFNNIDPAEDIL